MKTWIKRSLFALASAGIVLGSLTACGHRMHHGGWRADATPEQSAEWRGRMVERLRSQPLLEGLELETALRAFEALDARFDARPEETWVEAEMMIRQLKGRAEAEAVASAAVAVSIDGGLEAEERSAVLDICAWLDVSPLRVLP